MSGSAAFQRAKGLLATWFGLTTGEAENLLLTWSCENKVSACELATALVNDIHQGRPSGCSTTVLRYLETRLREIATVAGPRSDSTGPLPEPDVDPGLPTPDPSAPDSEPAPDQEPDFDPNPDLPNRPDADPLG